MSKSKIVFQTSHTTWFVSLIAVPLMLVSMSARGQQTSSSPDKVDQLLNKMTLAQKIRLIHGARCDAGHSMAAVGRWSPGHTDAASFNGAHGNHGSWSNLQSGRCTPERGRDWPGCEGPGDRFYPAAV